ncbi:Azurin precursor [Pigmentiphaga humi]|uniref:Azurin n=1 Tax=Pigmentiphaga humi TaxID=2478468 RepID=A0A3P4B5A0_9BURK|nr:azurin [Pigmentiphaga humi]VCU71474.1 Azurin precursor [Pigmentiphaga humi]
MKVLHTLPPLLLAAVFASPAMAATCDVDVEANDAMKFNKTSIAVPESCKQFTVKLKHTGKMPKASMGHNWVLSKAADLQGIAAEGIPAGLAKDYLKPNDARVIAHTKMLGGGESDSVTFDTSKLKAGENYAFFCSFPGHSGIMKGTLAIAK